MIWLEETDYRTRPERWTKMAAVEAPKLMRFTRKRTALSDTAFSGWMAMTNFCLTHFPNRLTFFPYSLKSLFSFNTLFFYLFLRFISKHCFFLLVLIGCKTNEKFSWAPSQIVTTAVPYAGVKKEEKNHVKRLEGRKKRSKNISSCISGFLSLLGLIQIKQVCTHEACKCVFINF